MARASQDTSPISSWEDIRLFLAVARGRSFSAGARTLATDQSTVSRRVAALEASLGRPLFERTSRSLRMTPYADALLPWAERVEASVRAMEDGARSMEDVVRGTVRLALTEGLALHVVVPRVLPALLEKYPELRIELITGDEAKDLVQHEADLALRFLSRAGSQMPKGELVARRIATMELGVIAAKSQKKKFGAMKAHELPWISYAREGVEVPDGAWFEAFGARRARLQCSSVETQLAAVRAGLGVAIATRAITMIAPDLIALDTLVLPPLPRLELFIVTRAAIRKVPRFAVVFDALVEALGELSVKASRKR